MTTPFDKDALLEQIDGDLEFLSEAVEIFNEDSPALLEELQQALLRGDGSALGAAAHTLKGMLGNFCAESAVESAGRLESMANQNNFSDGPQAVAEMQNEIVKLKLALEELLK